MFPVRLRYTFLGLTLDENCTSRTKSSAAKGSISSSAVPSSGKREERQTDRHKRQGDMQTDEETNCSTCTQTATKHSRTGTFMSKRNVIVALSDHDKIAAERLGFEWVWTVTTAIYSLLPLLAVASRSLGIEH